MAPLRSAPLLLACLALSAGCSNDGRPAGAAGTTAGGASEIDAGRDAGSDECGIPALQLLETSEGSFSELSITGDKLVFVSYAPITSIGTIEVIGTDGGDRKVLHTTRMPEGRNIRSVRAHGAAVYFLEENRRADPTYELFSVPVAGGSAAHIADLGKKRGQIIGVDDTYVYIADDEIFERIAIQGDAIERIGSMPAGAYSAASPQLSGDEIIVMAVVDDVSGLYQLNKAADDVETTPLTELRADDPCADILGTMLVTPTKLLCGRSSVVARSREGEIEATLIASTNFTDGNLLLASDGETFYFHPDYKSPAPLRRMTSRGEDERVVACDTGRTFRYAAIVGETEIFWIERIDPETYGGTTIYKIRRAAK